MANTGLIVAVTLAVAALGGNWLWNRRTHREHIDRLASKAQAPELLKEHSKVFNQREVIKVTDGIYSAVGFALANSILIEGDDGVVIVDVTESVNAGREVLAAFRDITKKPIRAIVYTHNHADHTYGATAFIEEGKPKPDIWSHQTLVTEMQHFLYTGPLAFSRAQRQFGPLVPQHINSGIGMNLRINDDTSFGFITPNKMFGGVERDVTVAGIQMKLVHIPGETADQIGVWLPKQRAFLCADDIYKAFPNLYAIRGTVSRSLVHWSESIDRMISFSPQYLVPSHTLPIEGEDKIKDLLTNYRDAIQFVHDQTLRYMNKGLMPDEVVAKVRLPDHLSEIPYLKELYGTVEWSVKGVFNTYIGWFSGDPAELSPLTPDELARRYVDLGGGVDKCVSNANAAIEKKDFRWAVTLTSHVIRVDPDNQDARQIASTSMMALGNEQTSANGRNYFFTSAMEVLGEVSTHINEGGRREGFIRNAPILPLMTMLRVLFKSEECGDVNTTILFEFTDSKTTITLTVRNSILLVSDKPNKSYKIKVTTTEPTWREITLSRWAAVTSYASGDFNVEGGLSNFRNVMSCFERDT